MTLLTTDEGSSGRKRSDFLHVQERICKPLHGVKPHRLFAPLKMSQVDCSMPAHLAEMKKTEETPQKGFLPRLHEDDLKDVSRCR
jgi:hypothetical protein